MQEVHSCNANRDVVPVMKTSTTAAAIIDTQQNYHQTKMEYSHCKADTIYSNIANETSAVLTNLQSNASLIKCRNLQCTYNIEQTTT